MVSSRIGLVRLRKVNSSSLTSPLRSVLVGDEACIYNSFRRYVALVAICNYDKERPSSRVFTS